MAIASGDPALAGVGWSADELGAFDGLEPTFTGSAALDRDAHALTAYVQSGQALIDRLPVRAARSEREQAAASAIHAALRSVRTAFLRRHAARVYDALTDSR